MAAIASQHAPAELFAKNAPAAKDRIAPEPTRHDREFYSPAAKRQISGLAQISALNPPAWTPAAWTGSRKLAGSKMNSNAIRYDPHFIYHKAVRREARARKSMLHD